MSVKITTLIENNPDQKQEFLAEHGLALYIEVDGLRILFDTGQSGNFLENAIRMNIDLNKLDYIIISHGHYDHANGLIELLAKITTKPTLIVGSEFFRKKYKLLDDGKYRYNGINFDESFISTKVPVIKVHGECYRLSENVTIYHHFDRTNDFEVLNSKFYYQDGDQKVSDDFADEIALAVNSPEGLVAIVGCSHGGVVNILKTVAAKNRVPLYGVIGGTHLVEADARRINRTIAVFKEMNLKMVAVSHCTGEQGLKAVQDQMPEQFVFNNTANVIELD